MFFNRRRFRSVHVASFNKFSKSKTRRKENLPRTCDTCLESSSRHLGGVGHIEVGGKHVLICAADVVVVVWDNAFGCVDMVMVMVVVGQVDVTLLWSIL